MLAIVTMTVHLPNKKIGKMSDQSPRSSIRKESAHVKLNAEIQYEHLLHNAILMTEMSMDIRQRCDEGEKYVSYLRSLALKVSKNLTTLQTTSKQFFILAQQLISSVLISIDNSPSADHLSVNFKLEFERLLNIVERELSDDDLNIPEQGTKLHNLSEKIKYLEAKQRLADNPYLQTSCSVRSVKSDVDEKYPENWSKDSLSDLNTVINLPSVPEDIFTSFPNKPTRTSSLSSLKSMRRVKLFLHRATASNNSTSDDDGDSSEAEDNDKKLTIGDTDDRSCANHPPPKMHLGNITEEAQQDLKNISEEPQQDLKNISKEPQ